MTLSAFIVEWATAPARADLRSDVANTILRVGFGSLVFVIHGLHKAGQGLRSTRTGEPWPLEQEVRELGAPLPRVSAIAATLVQFCAPLFIVAGLWTRPAAALLACALAGAVAQNLKARRDPQLALLYTLVAIALAVWGSSGLSIDALLTKPVPLASSP